MSKRLFVAIDLPDSVRQRLVNLDPHIAGMRWANGAQMHLTLGFFGNVPGAVDIVLREKLAAIQFGAFFLPIKGVGTFPPKGPPKIVWIGVGSGHPHLFQLHKRVNDVAVSVGLEVDLRSWHPHVTLARCRDVPANAVRKFLQSNVDLEVGMIHADAFHLYCSQLTPSGPIHTCALSISAR
jgi:2'-5' RNA ligase